MFHPDLSEILPALCGAVDSTLTALPSRTPEGFHVKCAGHVVKLKGARKTSSSPQGAVMTGIL